MAKQQNDVGINYYSAIVIDKGRRTFLFVLVLMTILIFGSLIFENILSARSWVAVAIPLVVAGSIYVLFPPTEHWVYQAWQAKPRMFERHSTD